MSDQHALEANGAEPDSVDPVAEFRAALASRVGDWYVVHTYAGYENRVKANLETRIQSLNMEDYIFQVEVPTEEVTEIKNGQPKKVNRKVLPGYILVRMDLNDESWGAVRNTPGVTGFVGATSRPTASSATRASARRPTTTAASSRFFSSPDRLRAAMCCTRSGNPLPRFCHCPCRSIRRRCRFDC